MVRNVFLQPFSEYVWYCIVMSGCLIICIAATISYREMGNYHCYQRPGIEQTDDANQDNGRKLKHRQLQQQQQQPEHSFGFTTIKQNQKFENNYEMRVTSTMMRPERRNCLRNDNDSTRQRHDNNLLNVSSSFRSRQRQQSHKGQSHPQQQQQQQQMKMSKNIIIETWNKLFGGECGASIRKNTIKKCPNEEINFAERSKKFNGKNVDSHAAPTDDDYYCRWQCQGDDNNAVVAGSSDDATAADETHRDGSDRNRRNVGAVCNCIVAHETNDQSSISRCILLFLGALCQQGTSETPYTTSRRCIVLLILLFGFLIFQFYSASIVGSLLMEKPKTIKTLRNLIDSSLDVGIEDIVYDHDFFRRTTDADALELFSKKVRIVHAKSDEVTYNFFAPAVGMEKVKMGGFAFHADSATFYKIIADNFNEREICELSEIQMFPKPEQYMMSIVQRGSPLRKMITYGLRRVVESGLLYHERTRWHSPKPMCVRQIQPEDLEVRLQSVTSALMLLLGGMCCSLILLLLENIVWLMSRRMNANRNGFGRK